MSTENKHSQGHPKAILEDISKHFRPEHLASKNYSKTQILLHVFIYAMVPDAIASQ